jgi:uncharacterized protein
MQPLIVNLRHLAKRDLLLQGELSGEELELNGLDDLIRVSAPVRYDLQVQKMEESILVQGHVATTLDCQCVRCLKPFPVPLNIAHVTLNLPLAGEEAVPLDGDLVDLTPYLREDIVLAFPQHPLCDPGCAGLQKRPASETEAQPGEQSQTTSSPWAALNKLKL